MADSVVGLDGPEAAEGAVAFVERQASIITDVAWSHAW